MRLKSRSIGKSDLRFGPSCVRITGAADAAWRHAPRASAPSASVVVEDGGARATTWVSRARSRRGGVGVGARAVPRSCGRRRLAASAGAPAAREHSSAAASSTRRARSSRRCAPPTATRGELVTELPAAWRLGGRRRRRSSGCARWTRWRRARGRQQAADLRPARRRPSSPPSASSGTSTRTGCACSRRARRRRTRRRRMRRAPRRRRGSSCARRARVRGGEGRPRRGAARRRRRPRRAGGGGAGEDEATQKLELVRAALAATAAAFGGDAFDLGEGVVGGGGGGAAPVDGWNHHLVVATRNVDRRASAWDWCALERDVEAEARAREARILGGVGPRGDGAAERGGEAEAELAATKAALAAAEAAAPHTGGAAGFPVTRAAADLREAEAALADVRNGEVPLLRRSSRGRRRRCTAPSARARRTLEAKATRRRRARSSPSRAAEDGEEAAMLADKRAAIAEAAAAAARAREADDEKRLRAAQAAEARRGRRSARSTRGRWRGGGGGVDGARVTPVGGAGAPPAGEPEPGGGDACASHRATRSSGAGRCRLSLEGDARAAHTAETECLAAQHAAGRAEAGRATPRPSAMRRTRSSSCACSS